MYKITEKVALNPTVTKMVIEAPLIAKKAKPGQFIIVRPFEDSERIPLTRGRLRPRKGHCGYHFSDRGRYHDGAEQPAGGPECPRLCRPAGPRTEVEGLKKVCVVGGGVAAPSLCHCP